MGNVTLSLSPSLSPSFYLYFSFVQLMLHSRPLFLFPSVSIYKRQSLKFGHGPLQAYTDCIRIVRHEDAVGYPRIHFTRILYVLVPTYLPTYI